MVDIGGPQALQHSNTIRPEPPLRHEHGDSFRGNERQVPAEAAQHPGALDISLGPDEYARQDVTVVRRRCEHRERRIGSRGLHESLQFDSESLMSGACGQGIPKRRRQRQGPQPGVLLRGRVWNPLTEAEVLAVAATRGSLYLVNGGPIQTQPAEAKWDPIWNS